MRKIRLFFTGTLFPCILIALLLAGSALLLFLSLPPLLTVFLLLVRLLALVGSIFVCSARMLPECKLTRLVTLLLFPIVGSIYLLAEKRKKPSRFPMAQNAPAFCGLLRKLSVYSAHSCGLNACYASSARYFDEGGRLLAPLLHDLSQAQKSIDLEFYIVDDGVFFDRVFSVLAERAKAGVAVRFLYDGFGCALTLPRRFHKKARAVGIAVKGFERVGVFPTPRLNCRDHRKLVLIDGKTVYTGGMNLADEYIGEKIRFGHWKDSMIRLTGDVALQFSALFEAHWSEKQITVSENTQRSGVPCIPFCDAPNSGLEGAYTGILTTLLENSHKKCYLTTPYLLPDVRLATSIENAVMGGVDVRILIPHFPDHKLLFLLTRDYARRLFERGVPVREYTSGFLHAKNVTADSAYAIVSSYNLDLRSAHLNYECGVLLQEEKIATEMERDFLSCWEQSSPVRKQTGLERLLCAILRPFAPLL